MDVWVCCYPIDSAPYGKCGFYSEKECFFKEHLNDAHDLTSASCEQEFDSVMLESSIHAADQPRFWCGFCKASLPQSKPDVGRYASTMSGERFNHIDAHFNDGMDILDWVYCKNRKTKREMKEEKEAKLGMWSPSPSNGDRFSPASQVHHTGTPIVMVTKPDNVVGIPPHRKRKNSDEERAWECVSCIQDT
jgi:hypothetical protein